MEGSWCIVYMWEDIIKMELEDMAYANVVWAEINLIKI
jgi:hypothetical protein